MNTFEIITLIGEFVCTEIDGVAEVKYNNSMAFIIHMESGEKYSVEVKEV